VALVAHRKAFGRQPDLETLAEADERVARQPLSALDAFQQETRIERSQLREGRNRRIQVSSDVERCFQSVFLKATKNPSRFAPEMGSGSGNRKIKSR
jgi:hypothetical protein